MNTPTRSFNVVAPEVAMEACLLDSTGRMVAMMSNVGRTRQAVLNDARLFAFSGRLHTALGDGIQRQANAATELADLVARGQVSPEVAVALSRLTSELSAGAKADQELHAGVTLEGLDAKLFDDRGEAQSYQPDARPPLPTPTHGRSPARS